MQEYWANVYDKFSGSFPQMGTLCFSRQMADAVAVHSYGAKVIYRIHVKLKPIDKIKIFQPIRYTNDLHDSWKNF